MTFLETGDAAKKASHSYLEAMLAAQRYLNAKRLDTKEPVRITAARRSDEGWVIAYRIGTGVERSFVYSGRIRVLSSFHKG